MLMMMGFRRILAARAIHTMMYVLGKENEYLGIVLQLLCIFFGKDPMVEVKKGIHLMAFLSLFNVIFLRLFLRTFKNIVRAFQYSNKVSECGTRRERFYLFHSLANSIQTAF